MRHSKPERPYPDWVGKRHPEDKRQCLPPKADIAECRRHRFVNKESAPQSLFTVATPSDPDFTAVRSRVPVGNTPDRAARVISDQQRAILGDCKRGRASPHFCALPTGYPEAGARLSLR